MPDEMYLSMPSADVGGDVRRKRALNCWPWVRSLTHSPEAVIHSPATERDKDIRYSSRTRLTTNNLREKHNVRHAINELHKLLPPELAVTEQAKQLYAYGCVTEMDIVQLIYRPMEPLGAFKDFEFSRSTMAARWKQGLSDVLIALQASPWLAPMPKELGVRVFDVMHDILTGRREPA
jgi:NTE family protein